jgi:hypothetical protein
MYALATNEYVMNAFDDEESIITQVILRLNCILLKLGNSEMAETI